MVHRLRIARAATRQPNNKGEQQMRKLKTMGVAMVAVLAMTAVAASAAHAENLTAPGKTSVILKAEGSGEQKFTVTKGIVNCTTLAIEQQTVAVPANEIEVAPTYSGCKAFGFNATVNFRSCKYKFTTSGANQEANVSIVGCTTGAANEIEITNIGNNCKINVPPQTLSTKVKFDNEGTGATADVKLTANIVNDIEYTEHGTSCSHDGTLQANGTYVGNATIKGFEDTAGGTAGSQVGILVD
jgi:hypothetical protein